MLRVLSRLSLVLLGSLAIAFALTSVFPPGGHGDFTLRMNELACVRQRVNPYAVWNCDVSLKPFYPNTWKGEPPEGCTEVVNAYAPWEYVYMYPLSVLPESCAWFSYCVMMFVACSFLVWFGLRTGSSLSVDGSVRFLVMSVPALAISYLLWSNWSVGNFMPFVLAATALMIVCLNRGRDVWAGVFWALAMVKPQIAILLSVPMVFWGKWRTCFVAAGVCLILTFVMSWVLKTPVVDLLVQGPAANTSFFFGCGTWPMFLCGHFGSVNVDIVIAAFLGGVVCFAMTWIVREEKDWTVRLFPAALCSCCWTYTQAYSHAMAYFFVLVLIMKLATRPTSRLLWCLLALALLIVPRLYLAWHGLFAYFGWAFPLSDYTHRCLDSLNSTMTLGLGCVLCLELRRRRR